MGKALYRKYRSKSLTEIVGQEHITDALEKAIKAGKISHAYLFTGPRGVGKTSIARILAHAVNDLPYSDDSAHLDIIEIDAASNRRIDEIRDLRDKVHVAPTSLKYKVYIIDEVHMLTREAFNALLKTLEEPPEHVIFILATTESHKLPETIISRTQRFAFRPIAGKAAVGHLKSIAKTENIKADDAALELIAEHGDGSFRDSISLLDQASGLGEKLTVETVQAMLGIAPKEVIESLLDGLESRDMQTLVTVLADMRSAGLAATSIARQLGDVLRQRLVDKQTGLDQGTIYYLLKELLGVPASTNPDHLLELILLGAVIKRTTPAMPALPLVTAPAARPTVRPVQAPATKPSAPATEPEAVPAATKVPRPAVNELDKETWNKILDDTKRQYSTLYGVLRMGKPSYDKQILTLGFRFAFHSKQLSEAGNRAKLMTIFTEHLGDGFKLEFIVNPDAEATPAAPAPKAANEPVKAPGLEAITNIFGGAEVLES